MPKRTDQWYRQTAYMLLTHAMWHLKFGPDNEYIREPDAGDMIAVKKLLECMREVEREGIERDIIEGST